MAYSNSGYILLGLVVERVSGTPYDVYVQRELFDRVGMPTAHYCSTSRIVPRRAHGYDVAGDELRLPYNVDFSWIYAAGALCMTARDLVAWTDALHHGRVLGAAAYRELTTPDTHADGVRLRYADGVEVDSILGHRAVHHGGDIPGFSTEVAYLPDDSLTVVVLMNTQGPVRPDALTREIVRVVVGDRSAPVRGPRSRTVEYVGSYVTPERTRRFVVRADSVRGGLTVEINGGVRLPVSYVGRDTFERGDVRYVFLRRNGRVAALHVDDVDDVEVAPREPPPEHAARP
jgi:CubicO group peptidase (beta-lactamase class C family)